MVTHIAPLRAVADNPWVDRVDTSGRELSRERADQAVDAGVHRRDHRGARIGTVLRQAAEQDDRAGRGHPRREHAHRFRVADELDRDHPHSQVEVKVSDRGVALLDRRNHQPVKALNSIQRRGDRHRAGQIDPDPARLTADLARHLRRPITVAPSDHHLLTPVGVPLGEIPADPVRPAEHQYGSARTQACCSASRKREVYATLTAICSVTDRARADDRRSITLARQRQPAFEVAQQAWTPTSLCSGWDRVAERWAACGLRRRCTTCGLA
jgi:hypothetical protein